MINLQNTPCGSNLCRFHPMVSWLTIIIISLPCTQYTPSHFLLFAADIPLKKAVAGAQVGLLPELGFVVNLQCSRWIRASWT